MKCIKTILIGFTAFAIMLLFALGIIVGIMELTGIHPLMIMLGTLITIGTLGISFIIGTLFTDF